LEDDGQVKLSGEIEDEAMVVGDDVGMRLLCEYASLTAGREATITGASPTKAVRQLDVAGRGIADQR